MNPSYPVSELFDSIQGEGSLVGVPSAFVRFSGCPLRCSWCDTPYASWEPAKDANRKTMTVVEIAEWIESTKRTHVVLTGGEPMIYDLAPLLLILRGKHVTIETAGVRRNMFGPVSLLSVSPKMANSDPVNDPRDLEGVALRQHRERRACGDVLVDMLVRQAVEGGDWQFKFVVQSDADIAEVETFLDRVGMRCVAVGLPPLDPLRVFLMPEGRTPEEVAAHGRVCAVGSAHFSPRCISGAHGNANPRAGIARARHKKIRHL